MASGRTTGARNLTQKDMKALEIAGGIAEIIEAFIHDEKARKDFHRKYGNVSVSTRDAALGHAGKLQRDALCTRGRQGKVPYSNRNLRWHPLILAHETPSYAREVDALLLRGKKLVFRIGRSNYEPEKVYQLPGPYCAPLSKWMELREELKNWNDSDWTANSCAISAVEYTPINYALETYAILGIAIATAFYKVELLPVYEAVAPSLERGLKELGFSLSSEFPTKNKAPEVALCPLCLRPINELPAGTEDTQRPPVWQPPWQKSKREEGEEESLQITHTEPLIEGEIRHTPSRVRYGHRWCNVAMTDHSVDETLDFMKAILEAHET